MCSNCHKIELESLLNLWIQTTPKLGKWNNFQSLCQAFSVNGIPPSNPRKSFWEPLISQQTSLAEKYPGGMYLTKLINYAIERISGGYLLCEVADYEITLNLLSFFDQIYQKN